MKKFLIIIIIALFSLTGCNFFEAPVQKEKTDSKENIDIDIDIDNDQFNDDTSYLYYYNNLSTKEKEIYSSIYNCLIDYQSKIELPSADYEQIVSINEYVLYDHPEIFYFNYFELQNQVDVCYYKPIYTYNQDEVTELTKQLENIRNQFISSLDSNSSDYDKLKAIYNYVIEKNTYVDGAKDNQYITSALIYGNTVCSGYVKTIQYLCEAIDINSAYIVGKALNDSDNSSHAWNLIELDGDYYYLDATWGDYVDEQNSFTMYSYFMFDSDTMLKLYQPTSDYKNTINGKYCYFDYENYYNESYDLNLLKSMVGNYRSNGINWMEFKFSDSCYQQAKTDLIDNEEMFDLYNQYASGSYSIQYFYLDSLNILIFKMS